MTDPNEIFVTFTDVQKQYIIKHIPSFFMEHLVKEYFGESWELEFLGICSYGRLPTEAGELLFETVKVESVIHLRLSLDGKVIHHPTRADLSENYAELGLSQSDLRNALLALAFVETHVESLAPNFSTYWH